MNEQAHGYRSGVQAADGQNMVLRVELDRRDRSFERQVAVAEHPFTWKWQSQIGEPAGFLLTCVRVPSVDRAILTSGENVPSTRCDATPDQVVEVQSPGESLDHIFSVTENAISLAVEETVLIGGFRP